MSAANHGTRCSKSKHLLHGCQQCCTFGIWIRGQAYRATPVEFDWNFNGAMRCICVAAQLLHISHREKALDSTRPPARNTPQQSTEYDYQCDSCKQESVEEPSPIRLHDAINLWQVQIRIHRPGQVTAQSSGSFVNFCEYTKPKGKRQKPFHPSFTRHFTHCRSVPCKAWLRAETERRSVRSPSLAKRSSWDRHHRTWDVTRWMSYHCHTIVKWKCSIKVSYSIT